MRQTLITVETKCPVCCALQDFHFEEGWLEDPAWRERVRMQPWIIVCEGCCRSLNRDFQNLEQYIDFVLACKMGSADAIQVVFKG